MSEEKNTDIRTSTVDESIKAAEIYYDFKPGKPGCPVSPMRRLDWWLMGILLVISIILLAISGTVMLNGFYS